ncbi:hypothetical protein [Acidiferrobacter sp.]|uniref:hypothetical protein n=1 Tax=Acidiferrobacter sp. TaxID=1872107 RepID=UPI00261F2089|nr:hypothetical protein [Acidiferrobacter sp.]
MTKPKALYLHVGTHKTGTTAIQALLATRSEAFAQAGFFVPRTGRIGEVSGHHNIAWELNADARYRPAFGTLVELCEELKASPHPAAIISSEDFEYFYCDARALKALKVAFEGCGYQVEVLMFLREQSAMIGSLYQELLKHGLDMRYHVFSCAVIMKGEFAMHGKCGGIACPTSGWSRGLLRCLVRRMCIAGPTSDPWRRPFWIWWGIAAGASPMG